MNTHAIFRSPTNCMCALPAPNPERIVRSLTGKRIVLKSQHGYSLLRKNIEKWLILCKIIVPCSSIPTLQRDQLQI